MVWAKESSEVFFSKATFPTSVGKILGWTSMLPPLVGTTPLSWDFGWEIVPKLYRNTFLSFFFFFSIGRDSEAITEEGLGVGTSCGICFIDELTSSSSSIIWVFWKKEEIESRPCWISNNWRKNIELRSRTWGFFSVSASTFWLVVYDRGRATLVVCMLTFMDVESISQVNTYNFQQ